jgi:molybdenum cofactor cytidylyltransferase
MSAGGTIAALILAAGYASRLGALKPLLPLGPTTFLEEAVQRLRAAGVDDIRVVTGHRAAELAPVLGRLKVKEIFNPDYDQGMFASVRAGVRSLGPDIAAFLLLPVDIPVVKPRTIRALLWAYRRGGARLIYPCFQGLRGHPPLIAVGCVADLPPDWNGGLQAYLRRYDNESLDLAVIDEAVTLDCDTPDDYRRLHYYAQRDGVPSQRECEAIWERYNLSEPVRRHCRTVAGLAGRLAGHLHCAGLRLDSALTVAAGYLHDLARGQPDHALAGARIVENLGYPCPAQIVAAHMNIRLQGQSLGESELVYLADKLTDGDRLVSLEARFSRAREKFVEHPEIMAAVAKRLEAARIIKNRLEEVLGIALEDLLSRYRGSWEAAAAGPQKIYLARHGAVEMPGSGRRYLGQLDVPLYAAGLRQAELLSERSRRVPLAAIYCSDLQRAVQTAAIIAGPHGLTPAIRKEFREIGLGAWEGLTFGEVKERYPAEYAARGRDFSRICPPGGESFLDCAHRVLPAFHEVVNATPGDLLIVGHAGVNRILLCLAQGRSLDELFDIPQDYGCLNVMTCRGFDVTLESLNETRFGEPEMEFGI